MNKTHQSLGLEANQEQSRFSNRASPNFFNELNMFFMALSMSLISLCGVESEPSCL